MLSTNQIVLRLALSIVLSGLIGIERESIKRPAGFRTHILVCVGSTLVMLTSLYIFNIYKYETALQPDRLGAQIISGIGFLGAGTIIRQGSSVKGLTTAAGLWAVACIGISVGVGFYLGAIITTILVLITLIAFGKVEKHIRTKRNYMSMRIVSSNRPGQLGRICKTIGETGASITSIELDSEEEETVIINMILRIPDSTIKYDLMNRIGNEDGVIEVSEKV